MTLEEIRLRKIKLIINSLYEAKNRGISVSHERLTKEVGIRFNAARRTAMDYIDNAIEHCGCFQKGDEILFKGETYDKVLLDGEWEDA